jgi:SAM-dependent methyltransferase
LETMPLPVESSTQLGEPWQINLFRRSLKKQQKLKALLQVLGEVEGGQCILITSGDNNGALNWYFKQQGGNWSWADTEESSIVAIAQVTGDPVSRVDKEKMSFPCPDNCFEVVVTIDVHEHLPRPQLLNRELARIVKAGGQVIVTTPGGDEHRWANRIKNLVGMRSADYGHVVPGYSVAELQTQLREAGLMPVAHSSYSRFFTELVELIINFVFVKILARRSQAKVERGQVAPQTKEQLKSVEKSYRAYSLLYPLLALICRLDFLLRFTEGYAVIVVARKV